MNTNNRSFKEMIKDLENSGKDETKKFDELIRDLYTGINKKANMIKERVNFVGASKDIIETKNKEDELVADTHFFKFLEKIINNPTWAKSQGYPIDSQGNVKININKLSNILQEAKETLLSLDKGRETIYNAYFQKTKDTLEIEKLKDELKKLKSKTFSFDQYKKFYEEYSVINDLLNKENEELTAEVERLEKSSQSQTDQEINSKIINKNYKEIQQLQVQVCDLQEKLFKVTVERNSKENAITGLNQEIVGLTDEIERLKIQFYNSNCTYMDKFGNILTSNEIREIQEKLDYLTLDFKDLKEYKNQLEQENAILKLENEELKMPMPGNNTSLSLMHQKVQQSLEVIRKLELENAELKNKMRTGVSKNTEAEIESLEKQLEETKYSLEVFKEDRTKYFHLSYDLRDEIESLNKELSSKNAEICVLRSLFGKPQWTPQNDFNPIQCPGPWTATYDTNTNTVSNFYAVNTQSCEGTCDSPNYCESFGCEKNNEIDQSVLITIDRLKEKEYREMKVNLPPKLPEGYVLHSDGIISFPAGTSHAYPTNLADNIVPTTSTDIPEYVKKAADNYPNCKVIKNNVQTEEVDKSISEKSIDYPIARGLEYAPTKEMTTPYLECKNELQGLSVKAEMPNIRKRLFQPYF